MHHQFENSKATYVSPFHPVFIILIVVMLGAIGCTDELTRGGENSGENQSSDDAGHTDDDADATNNNGDEDTDSSNSQPPPDPCLGVNCGTSESCYFGECYQICETFLDCEDGENCRYGRCFEETCDDVDCGDDHACYRGSCYDPCGVDEDCGVGSGLTCEDGACVSILEQCEGLECNQYACPQGQITTLSGTVNIPSGDFPLPNVTVYVPNEALAPLPEGATCATCDELVSGDPILQNTTGIDGRFELPNFPVADEVPLVIQTGKWRREVTITGVDPCQNNEADPELTRLPRNQSEGNIPQIAVATGGCDNLECLVFNIGLDESEFTTDSGSGAVHLFAGQGGASSFQDGTSYSNATSFWNDADKMLEYDLFLNSCECSDVRTNKSDAALANFETFLQGGGRAFLSHFQRVWLMDSAGPIGDVANWRQPSLIGGPNYAVPQTAHSEGQDMADWLDFVDALDGSGNLSITADPRVSVMSIDESVATNWLYWEAGSHSQSPVNTTDTPAYFSFNMPLGTEGDDACGRAVFADLHVSGGSTWNFPSGCSSGTLSAQEQALVYMLFDLTACIAPECEPATCDDVPNSCGIFSDGCGSIVDCGECCVEIDEPCSLDQDCCDSLWCDGDTGLCTDRCRLPGERCTDSSQCCGSTSACTGSATEQGVCIQG
jgi:hypothetical protein